MKRNAGKALSLFLILVLPLMSVVSAVGSGQAARAESAPLSGATGKRTLDQSRPQNPNIGPDGSMIWDTIYFGSYWQNDTNGDGKADMKDAKEPIRWRVLSVEGDDAFLVTDRNIAVQEYNAVSADVTWEKCTLRSWLNGYGADQNDLGMDYTGDSFAASAFTDTGRSAIKTTNVENKDNPEYGMDGGNNTEDKVFLLSAEEVMNASYGFTSADTREAQNTEYVKTQGAYTSKAEGFAGNGWWWLRSPGSARYFASNVKYDGNVVSFGTDVNGKGLMAVRPAMHLNLEASDEWQTGESISPEGEVQRPVTPTEPPLSESTETPAKTPRPDPPTASVPTKKPDKATKEPTDHSTKAPSGNSPKTSTDKSAKASADKETSTPDDTPGGKKTGKAPGRVKGLSVKSKKRAAKLKWKRVAKAKGYQLQMSTTKDFGIKAQKIIKKTSITANYQKGKKKRFVRVRAFRIWKGKKLFGKWSAIKVIKFH